MQIRNISVSPDHRNIIIQDAGLGGYLMMDLQTYEIKRISFGHGGAVTSISFANSTSNVQPANEMTNTNQVRSGLLATVG